jgi:hypothetical protein
MFGGASSLPIDFGILATGALGFTVALAWNDAVSIAVRGTDIFGAPGRGGVGAAALHAAIVTVLVILVAVAVNTVARIVHHASGGAHSDHIDHSSGDAEARRMQAYDAIAFRTSSKPDQPAKRPRSVVRLWSPDTD